MKTPWRWFFRCALVVGLLFVVLSILVAIRISRPHVTQSNGYTNRNADGVSATLSQSLPRTTNRMRYCRVSVGMGGRLLLYRFSAPLTDLHSHANAEFAAHWDQSQSKTTPNTKSPITEREIALYKSGFGIDADWMLPPPNAVGTLYEPADGRSSHRPTIFVDDTNGVLYFQMMD